MVRIGSRPNRSPTDRVRRTLPVLLLGFALLGGVGFGLAGASHASAPGAGLHPTPTASVRPSPSAAPGYGSGSSLYQCDGMYWKGAGYWYVPSYCYGHDEPTMSFLSTAAHSGEDAHFQVVLPGAGPTTPQGSLYAALWFGGAVRDPNSTGGGGQAFLELQFYPAAPIYTGTGSGHQDCLPNGAFNPDQTATSLASGDYFSCAVVWQLAGSAENAAFAGPMDVVGSTDAILVLHAGDAVSVTYAGTAQSTTQGWNLTIHDATTGQSAATELLNGTLALSPYYTTAAKGNTLSWGASSPGAISFAYEIGHTLNTSNTLANATGTCDPGDQSCQSYWPGLWNQSGQMRLQPPLLGTGSSADYPTSIGFSSSQGGEAEVNATACLAPSSSTLRNCMYPYFQYRAGSYGFAFGTSPVANDTHDYGNVYQFPGATGNAAPAVPVVGGVGFAQNVRYQDPPIGAVQGLVVPAHATVELNPIGQTRTLAVGSAGGFGGRFLEGLYWLNVSKTGCTPSSQSFYLGPGDERTATVTLRCTALGASATVAPNPVPAGRSACYTSYATGGTLPYAYAWSFGTLGSSTLPSPCVTWRTPGSHTAKLTVTDAASHSASVYVPITVVPNWVLDDHGVNVTLYGNNVSTSGTSLPSSFPMSTTFPTGQPDINAGYLFPGPVSPVTWTFLLNQTTAGPLYLDTAGLATAHFFASLASPTTVNGTPAVAPVRVTIIAELDAGSTVLGIQPQTRNLSLNGSVTEFNISFSPEAGFVASPSGLTLSFTWYQAQSNGKLLSSQLVFHSGANYPVGVTLPMLAPVLVAPPTLTLGSVSTASVRATILSPFGSYDLGTVNAVLNGATTVPFTLKAGAFVWKMTHLVHGQMYILVVTALDQQGAGVRATIAWTE